VCSAPRPQQPARPYTQKSKHPRHRKAPTNTLLMPSPRTPPPRALTEATHTRDTRKAWRLVFLWGFEPVSPVFAFFSGPARLRTILTHTQTPTSCTPTLAWPEDEAAAPSRCLDDDRLHPHRVHHPPTTVSAHDLWSTRDRPRPSTHKESASVELPVA